MSGELVESDTVPIRRKKYKENRRLFQMLEMSLRVDHDDAKYIVLLARRFDKVEAFLGRVRSLTEELRRKYRYVYKKFAQNIAAGDGKTLDIISETRADLLETLRECLDELPEKKETDMKWKMVTLMAKLTESGDDSAPAALDDDSTPAEFELDDELAPVVTEFRSDDSDDEPTEFRSDKYNDDLDDVFADDEEELEDMVLRGPPIVEEPNVRLFVQLRL